jgi:hypothetical protein
MAPDHPQKRAGPAKHHPRKKRTAGTPKNRRSAFRAAPNEKKMPPTPKLSVLPGPPQAMIGQDGVAFVRPNKSYSENCDIANI